MKTLRSFRTSSRARGYTAVEVLSALTLLSIGAAGVIGMQRVTIQGQEDARRFDMGTNIANEWCTRLQRDATTWTKPNDTDPQTIDINTTQWLNTINGSCGTIYCNPATPATFPGNSGSFDMFGRDVDPGGTGAMFCAQYRLTWIQAPGNAPPFAMSAQMRAEVRVFWSRLERNIIGSCASATPDANPNNYHMVSATTVVRENAAR